jgi:hypothetical protein
MKQIISTAILVSAFCFAAFAQANENLCPNLTITSLDYPNNLQIFTVEAGKEIEKYSVKYKWTVKGGKTIAGKDTKTIVFLREGNEYSVVTEVEGLPKDCERIAAENGVFDPPHATEIHEFGEIPTGELRARLDNFLSTLQNDPTTEGLVIISSPQNPVNKLRLYDNHFKFRNFDQTRISFMLINESPQKTRLFIIPAGASRPTFENSLIIKAEEFDKLYNLFRPKPITKKRKK